MASSFFGAIGREQGLKVRWGLAESDCESSSRDTEVGKRPGEADTHSGNSRMIDSSSMVEDGGRQKLQAFQIGVQCSRDQAKAVVQKQAGLATEDRF